MYQPTYYNPCCQAEIAKVVITTTEGDFVFHSDQCALTFLQSEQCPLMFDICLNGDWFHKQPKHLAIECLS